jgi:hypothetical protein
VDGQLMTIHHEEAAWPCDGRGGSSVTARRAKPVEGGFPGLLGGISLQPDQIGNEALESLAASGPVQELSRSMHTIDENRVWERLCAIMDAARGWHRFLRNLRTPTPARGLTASLAVDGWQIGTKQKPPCDGG